MLDPTRTELLEFLRIAPLIAPYEPSEFDIEEAIYWFAYNWHGGQTTNLYSVLSTSPFMPGLLAEGPQSEVAAALLEDIEWNFKE